MAFPTDFSEATLALDGALEEERDPAGDDLVDVASFDFDSTKLLAPFLILDPEFDLLKGAESGFGRFRDAIEKQGD